MIRRYSQQIVRILIWCYPRGWRDRYAVEFEAMLAQYQPGLGDFADMLFGAVDAHVHYHTSSRVAKWGGRLTNLAMGGIVIALLLLTCIFWLVAFFAVPPPTDENTTQITGTFVSAISPCCDDLMIRLQERRTIFYFNRRGADQEMVNELFQPGETVSITVLTRALPISSNQPGSTPAFVLEAETGAYYAPIPMNGSSIDFRVHYGVKGLLTGLLLLAIIYIQSRYTLQKSRLLMLS